MSSTSHRARVTLTALLAATVAGSIAVPAHAEQPARPKYFSIKGKRGTFHEDNIRGIEVVISGNDSMGRQSIAESYWQPDFKVPPHFHTKHAETFYIISGQVEWTVGGETHVLSAGDAVHIPPNTIHSVKVVGDKEMHSLMIYEPGGYEENVVLEASLTPEQRKDPKIQKLLQALSDFHPVSAR